jgi:hypothetical protein
VRYSKKGGDGRPLLWQVRWLTASCRPSSSRPWPSSLPLRFIPPFARGICAGCHRSAALLPPGTSACVVGARRFAGSTPADLSGRSASEKRAIKKTRGCQLSTPPDRLGGALALLPALFLAALRSLLRHYSSLECGCSAVFTGSQGYNRWAERSTLIQDVDYG